MTHTKASPMLATRATLCGRAGQTFGDVVRRMAIPFLIFAGVLFGFLSLSWYLILPQLTQMEVAGVNRDAMQLKEYVARLEANVLRMEERRDQLVTPLRAGLYGAIKEDKLSISSFGLLRSQVYEVASQFSAGGKQVVNIDELHYLPEKGSLELKGTVRNVGPRSMTVLAQFVDAFKELPGVSAVEPPRFVRKHNASVGYFSPFHFHIVF